MQKKIVTRKIKWNWFLISPTCMKEKKVIYDIGVSFWVSLIPTGIAFIYENRVQRVKGRSLRCIMEKVIKSNETL